MTETFRSTFGVYRNRSEVENAVRELIRTGFESSDISVLFPKHNKIAHISQTQDSLVAVGALIGAGVGLALGFAFSLLLTFGNIGAPTTVDHGLASPASIVIILTLATGLIGTAAGAMVGIGTPQTEARRYRKYVRNGGIVLSVHRDTARNSHDAEKILQATGAQDVHTMNENRAWSTVMQEEAVENFPFERGTFPDTETTDNPPGQS